MVRRMRDRDYSDVFKLWEDSPGIGLSPADSERAIIRFIDHNPMTCFVAEEDGKIVGAILGGFDGRRGYIHHLVVDPNYRHRGIGTSLVDQTVEAMRQMRIQKIHIFVKTDIPESLDFWRHRGWEPRDDVQMMSRDFTGEEPPNHIFNQIR